MPTYFLKFTCQVQFVLSICSQMCSLPVENGSSIRDNTFKEKWLFLSQKLSIDNSSSATGGTSCHHPAPCWDWSGLVCVHSACKWLSSAAVMCPNTIFFYSHPSSPTSGCDSLSAPLLQWSPSFSSKRLILLSVSLLFKYYLLYWASQLYVKKWRFETTTQPVSLLKDGFHFVLILCICMIFW